MDQMINFLRKMAIGLGVAGILAVAVATPSLARVVHPASNDIAVCYPSLAWQNRC
jgi:hypothetical protein